MAGAVSSITAKTAHSIFFMVHPSKFVLYKFYGGVLKYILTIQVARLCILRQGLFIAPAWNNALKQGVSNTSNRVFNTPVKRKNAEIFKNSLHNNTGFVLNVVFCRDGRQGEIAVDAVPG